MGSEQFPGSVGDLDYGLTPESQLIYAHCGVWYLVDGTPAPVCTDVDSEKGAAVRILDGLRRKLENGPTIQNKGSVESVFR